MKLSEAVHDIGLAVYREPWKFDIEPDFINDTGSQFYVFDDLTDYLRRDPIDKKVIYSLRKAVLMRAYNPKTEDTDILVINGEDTWIMDSSYSYESLCYWIDMIRAHYKFKVD